jgi:hypothetical protein
VLHGEWDWKISPLPASYRIRCSTEPSSEFSLCHRKPGAMPLEIENTFHYTDRIAL